MKSRQVWKMDSSGLSVHAGKGHQQESADSSALLVEFSQPYGICWRVEHSTSLVRLQDV